MALTEEQFNRLPVYLKREITALRDQLQRVQAKNDWLEDENRVKVEASNTVVAEGYKDNTALPNNSRVEFFLNNPSQKHWKASVTVHVAHDGKSIEIMGSDSIGVIPQSSNFIHVFLRDQ